MSRRFKPATKIEVRPSTGKGRGVFAMAAVRRGEIIESAPVLLVPTAQNDTFVASFLGHFMFQTDDGRRYAIGLGFSSMINHSDDANAVFSVSTERIVIHARRAIAAGAEVTVDYGWTAAEWGQAGFVDTNAVVPKPSATGARGRVNRTG